MNAPQAERKKGFYGKGMNKPVVLSVLLHIFIVVIGTVGLPYFAIEKEPIEMAITVEIAPLAAISQTNVRDKPQEAKEEKPEPPPKSKPEPPKPEPPKEEPDILSPREPVVEEIPEPPKEEPEEVEEKPEPKPEPKPPVKPKNKPKPPEPKKEPEKKPEPKEEPKQEDSIESLLNDLLPTEQSTPTETDNEVKETSEPSQTSQIAAVSNELTRSELDDLNAGVQPCWFFDAGARNAEELVVSLRVFLNPDMRVREVEIMDQMRYGSDPAFRTAADKARWALLNEKCSKLRLPPERYDQWKVFIYNFDPREMLN